MLIEIQTRDRLAVHLDVAESVDAMLRGYPIPPELRYLDETGNLQIEKPAPQVRPGATQGFRKHINGAEPSPSYARPRETRNRESAVVPQTETVHERGALQTMRVLPYGVARNRLLQAARRLGVPVYIVDHLHEAEVLVTLRSHYRKRQRPVVDAEDLGVPIFVLRSNTISQMQQFLADLFNISADFPPDRGTDPAMMETQAAIEAVLNGERYVELSPAVAHIRRLQHQMARQANLTSHSYGKEPSRRVRIFRD